MKGLTAPRRGRGRSRRAAAGGARASRRAPARHAAPGRRATGAASSSRTPEGGFRIGNPAAPVKLVEYGSLTCPHCAAFAHEGEAALRPELCAHRPGQLRISQLSSSNGADVVATCSRAAAGPAGFFPMVQQPLRDAAAWIGRITGLSRGAEGPAQGDAGRRPRWCACGADRRADPVAAPLRRRPRRAPINASPTRPAFDRLGKMIEARRRARRRRARPPSSSTAVWSAHE